VITAIVQFKVAEGTTLDQAKAMFERSAPNYRGVPGLVRKYYLFDPSGTAGGAYLWESRAAAERLYTEEWRATIAERFGAAPEVRYFETPVIVDNAAGEVIVGAAA